MNSQISIRKAKIEDIPEIIYLEKSSLSKYYSTGTSKQDILKYLRQEAIFLGYVDNRLVGKVSCKSLDNLVVISGLIILPEFRGRRWGLALSQYVINLFPQANTFKLTVHPQNQPAINIYLRLGFVGIKVVPNYYGDNEPRLIMEYKR